MLGGEDPIDHVQREALATDRELHPLLERIMRIHVTEEARHLSFARSYLRRTVPGLPRRRRALLRVQVPVTLGVMAAMMLRPSPTLVKRYGVPRRVLRRAYGSPEARAGVVASLRKVRELCDELGLRTPAARLVWRAMRIDG